MAHFAQLNEKNTVQQVIVVNNQELLDDNGQEQESRGIAFCQQLLGGVWVQTSYNGSFRKNFAGVGFVYDESRDAFIPPTPFLSWTLNEETCMWEAPIPYPSDNQPYVWDEDGQQWVVIEAS